MKRFILLAIILAIGFFGFGCLEQNTNTTQNETINQTISSPKVIIFYDPANGGLEKSIIQKTSVHLPSVGFEYKCVDFTKIMYGQASQSEQICLAEDQKYNDNMALFNELLNKNMSAVIYVDDNGTYLPINESIHPLVLAKNICSVYKYPDCNSLPELKQLKAKIYAKEQSDVQFYSQITSAISSSGIKLDTEVKIVDENDKASLKKTIAANFLPIMVVENGSVDDNFVMDLYVDYISKSSLFVAQKTSEGYVFYPKGGSMSYYIGDEPLINGIAYVPSGKEEFYKGIFDGLSLGGIFINASYVGVNNSVGSEIAAKANLSYLPILVIDANSLTEKQINALDNIAAKSLQVGSSLVLYAKKIEDKYYVYTSLSEPDLFVGKKLDVVTLDLYVMSHCPFGLQMQKAIVPVVELFNGTNRLVVNNKFVYYTMHGEEETKDNLYEYCVGKNAPAKEWAFIRCFVENDGDENLCMQKLALDKSSIDNCVSETRTKFGISGTSFPIYAEENAKYGVQGSPTLVFMGKQIQLQRSPEAIKEFVCSMLAEPLPSACNKTLSNEPAAYGFGPINASSSSSSSSASCG